MNLRWISVTTLVAGLTAAALLVAGQLAAPLWLRVPLGLAVALVIPGFLGYRAVRGRWPRTLADAAVSLVVSIGVLAVLGTGLNLLPTGLTSTSWSVALLVLSIVLGTIGDRRRETLPPADPAEPPRARRGGWLPQRKALIRIGQLVVCGALLCAGAVVTLNSQRAELNHQHLTEMWLTTEGRRNVVHIRNEEGIPVEYRMVTSIVGEGESTTTIHLPDGAEWTASIDAPPQATSVATSFPISVSLYRGDEGSIYREVRINKAPE